MRTKVAQWGGVNLTVVDHKATGNFNRECKFGCLEVPHHVNMKSVLWALDALLEKVHWEGVDLEQLEKIRDDWELLIQMVEDKTIGTLKYEDTVGQREYRFLFPYQVPEGVRDDSRDVVPETIVKGIDLLHGKWPDMARDIHDKDELLDVMSRYLENPHANPVIRRKSGERLVIIERTDRHEK